jgi:hypothetical protein
MLWCYEESKCQSQHLHLRDIFKHILHSFFNLDGKFNPHITYADDKRDVDYRSQKRTGSQ